MNGILSLFDGISCARVALERAGIKYDNYFASEVDKYAIKIAEKNYPSTVQVGDVTQVTGKEDWSQNIDLLIGGSPCQGFSIAGKQLNFDDPRSKLFFEYLRILEAIKPQWFILENVKMKKECQDLISEKLGVQPILIDSALVSAQSRKRNYWTNIPNVVQPEDKGILLKDIIEEGLVDRDKSYCIDAHYYKGGSQKYLKETYEKFGKRQLVQSERRLMVNRIGEIGKGGQGERIYTTDGKSITISASSGGPGGKTGLYLDGQTVRKLTPVECERLQTLPDNYTEGISNTQRYKALGNGFTVDVIAHILSFIKLDS
jgi:site-specific DNA-cytosine methylase